MDESGKLVAVIGDEVRLFFFFFLILLFDQFFDGYVGHRNRIHFGRCWSSHS